MDVKALDLARKHVTLEEALKLAGAGSIRIESASGQAFVLQIADEKTLEGTWGPYRLRIIGGH